MKNLKTTAYAAAQLYHDRDIHDWEQLASRAYVASSRMSHYTLQHQQIHFGALVARNHRASWPRKAQTAAQQAHEYGALLYAAWHYISCYIPEMQFFVEPNQTENREQDIRRQCEYLHELKFAVPSPEVVIDCLSDMIPIYGSMDVLPEGKERLWVILLEGRQHRPASKQNLVPPTPQG